MCLLIADKRTICLDDNLVVSAVSYDLPLLAPWVKLNLVDVGWEDPVTYSIISDMCPIP